MKGAKHMANYNEHKCFTCGKTFDYCGRCVITPVVYKAEGFCSEECSYIFNTLSKHGCNLTTAEETLEALKDCDTTNVTEDIRAHIDIIKTEVQEIVEPELTSNIEEVTQESVVKTVFKNNKKKW